MSEVLPTNILTSLTLKSRSGILQNKIKKKQISERQTGSGCHHGVMERSKKEDLLESQSIGPLKQDWLPQTASLDELIGKV